MFSRRSASVGALPREKKHYVSRNESGSGISLDVRCACQYFQCDSLLPERANPTESRPTSKLGFHSDEQRVPHTEDVMHNLQQYRPMNTIEPHTQQTASMRSYDQQDRISMHSSGAAVDLSFLEKYPELEETARKRKLIVRTISNASEEVIRESSVVSAGMKLRHASDFGIGEFDTLSMRSGTSVRRISRSPSKAELFIADINIPTSQHTNMDVIRPQRSASATRRSSNVELSHFGMQHASQAPFVGASIRAPSINLIAATPSGVQSDTQPQFPNSPQRAQSAAIDHRNAKRPFSVDYMRPSESKEFLFNTEGVLPQNRPIDMSQYGKDTLAAKPLHAPAIGERRGTPTPHDAGREGSSIESHEMIRSRDTSPYRKGLPLFSNLTRSREASPLPASVKSLEDTITELEDLAAERNLVKIFDNIKAETKEPESNIDLGKTEEPSSLNLGSETKIDIVSSIPLVDIEKLVQQEIETASKQKSYPRTTGRQLSPPAKRARTPTPMSTLQLPNAATIVPTTLSTTQTQPTQSRSNSPSRMQGGLKHLSDHHQMQLHTVTITGPLQEASPEAKSTYAARFKSLLSSIGNGYGTRRQKSASPSPTSQKSSMLSPMIEKASTPHRERSPTPKKDKSPSPNRVGKVSSMLSKLKPTQIEVVSSSNSVKPRKPEAEPLSVKVTETFSLKVDEMDQYCTKPPKPPQSMPALRSMHSSRDDFSASERISVDMADAFAPIVIGSPNRQTFLAGNRTIYSSDIDIRQKRPESELHSSSKEPSIGSASQIVQPKGGLFSAPIIVGQYSPSGLPVTPSSYTRTSAFVSERTQSQDRAPRVSGSCDDIFKSRITKTVSFNFDERQSRLSEFKSRSPSTATTQQQAERSEYLDRAYFSRDHDYEPIGEPATNESVTKAENANTSVSLGETVQSKEFETLTAEIREAAELQKELEDRYFTANAVGQSDANETPEAQVSAEEEQHRLEEPTPKAEKKGFMATAQDHTRRMQTGIKNQATKIKTRLRSTTKTPVSGSPKTKKKDRFKTPQFSKLKMPEIKKPDMSKIKEFKRPEFTKFNKPDISKFKLTERFTTLKLKRSHSFKHEDEHDNELSTQSPDSQPATDNQPHKKTFEFNFGTYPRAFRKKKKPVEPVEPILGTESASMNPSNITQPSFESSSSPQGDRGPGPVRSRWADKFSDVSYNDSEGSRYRRYGSEQESFDKESSLERRMKDDLEESASETHDMGILGGVADTKQFAEFDEENRAIHEISNLRSGEFKRRPIVHQDSDLRSEDSKEAVGWTDKEVQRNKLLRKAEMEAEASFLKYRGDNGIAQETQSTTSSTGRKVVMEEIDDDEFFLRKRGISEDNIELRQYISSAIRGGYDMPINALEHVGQSSEPPMDFGDYDVPPPKPRRLHKGYRPQDDSQEFDMQRSDYGDDFSVSQNGSDFFVTPKKPLRKERSRSKYSMDSENPPLTDDRTSREQYFDNDEDYLRPPHYNDSDLGMNDLSFTRKDVENEVADDSYPQPPRRQKRRTRESSLEKDSLSNGFGGKSVSNSFLQQPKDVIVYRTEHEYHIPMATPENYLDDASTSTHKSRSASQYDDNEHMPTGLQSYDMAANVKTDYNGNSHDDQNKYIIDMMENDGYAIVRKEHMPKPTPPARRKRFARSPGERFATLPNMRTKRGTPPPERPPPPHAYIPSVEQPLPPIRKSSHSLDTPHTYNDDYEEPEALERPESPRNLQSGEVINKMKYRPLPAPPRPPREKRQRGESKSYMQTNDEESALEYADSEDTEHLERKTESEIDERFEEVEAATQTDPLPDNYEVAAFEIDDSMRVIEPRRRAKTVEELLQEEAEESELQQMISTEDEQLTRGLQRFRDANQRSLSERSRASSQADRSKSLSRPQTPSAIVIESRVSTPSPYKRDETVLEASIVVRPLDDLDLEEAELRREGLLSDSSQQSKSDIERDFKPYVPQSQTLQVDQLSDANSSTELTAGDYEQRLQSDEERETQSEQEKVEPTLSDLEAEFEQRYSKIYNLENELTEGSSKPYSDEESDHQLVKRSTISPNRDQAIEKLYREQLRFECDIEEAEKESSTVEQADAVIINEGTNSLVHPGEPTKEIEYESYTTTKQETEQVPKQPSPPSEYPQPPPRRKSASNIETATPNLVISEQPTTTVTPAAAPTPVLAPPPTTVSDLAVERLHVHALQAGQIMVSQMHGAQINSEQLECNSANLVVNNIQLPPGFIENIVERVRCNDRPPTTLLTVETQTSLTTSSEELINEQDGSPVPPKKPARQKQSEPAEQQQQAHKNPDEQTQTDPIDPLLTALPPLLPNAAEYMQTLAPFAYYNMHRVATDSADRSAGIERTESMHRRRRPYRRHSSSSGNDETTEGLAEADKQHTHRRPTRSSTQPPVETPTIAQAASQFLSACSLSLVNIINQLTDYVRSDNNKAPARTRQVPTLVALFIVITLVLLLFLLSGKNVHTHHWDFFNPPGNDGRK